MARRLALPLVAAALLAALVPGVLTAPPAAAATPLTSFTMSSNQPASAFGQSVTLFATLTGTTTAPTGSVDFFDGGTPLCTTRPLSRLDPTAAANCVTSTLAVGTHAITATYSGDGTYDPAASTDYEPAFSQVVAAAATTTALTDAPDPSVVSGPVTLTATVSVVAPGGGAPAGTVAFRDGGTNITGCGAQALNTGTATCLSAGLGLGSHTLTAVYAGSASHLTSTSAPASHAVGPASTTSTVLADDATTTWGQPVTFTATIAAGAPATVDPSAGTVRFASDGTTIPGCATRPVSSGTATCTTSALAVGSHDIVAEYGGVADYQASTSTAATQTVGLAPTSVTLGLDHDPARFGQPITVTATVTDTISTPPSGVIAFFVVRPDHTRRWIATTTLSSGGASTSISDLPVGTHTISAVYRGTAQFASSNATEDVRVTRSATATTVTSSRSPAAHGRRIALRAAVTPTPPGSGLPGGTVAFFRMRTGGARIWIATADLADGTATIHTAALPVGEYQIVAVYRGDAGHAGSQGSTTQHIDPD